MFRAGLKRKRRHQRAPHQRVLMTACGELCGSLGDPQGWACSTAQSHRPIRSLLGSQPAAVVPGVTGTSAPGVLATRFSQARYLDLAMSVLIRSTFFCFSFNSSGLRGVSGSRSMYRSGMRTLSGVESCGGTRSLPPSLPKCPLPAPSRGRCSPPC